MEEIFSISKDENKEANVLDSSNSIDPLSQNQDSASSGEETFDLGSIDTNNNNEVFDLGSSDDNQNIDTLDLGLEAVNTKQKSGGFFGFFKKKNIENNMTNLENAASDEQSSDLILQESTFESNQGIQNGGSISLEGAQSNGDIFQELELGELNFGEQTKEVKIKEPVEPLVYVQNISGAIFWIGLIIFIGFFVSVFVRNSDASFISNMPLACDYIGSAIDGYDNSTDCKTLSGIISTLDKEKNNLEKVIVQELSALIPKKMTTNYILSSPEVKFIQEKTGSARISISKILQEFEDIRIKSGGYQGNNIECLSMQLDEKGNLEVSCSFFGTSIIESTNQGQSLSSRGVALDFLANLQGKNSSFTIVDYPKVIDISKYDGTEGIKVIFSTQTSLTLKLKYSPLSSNNKS